MDTMWVRHLMDSFDTDDKELAQIALQSVLADLGQVVTGGRNLQSNRSTVDYVELVKTGEHGSAFNIGDYGFFSEQQFQEQAKLLSSAERENVTGDRFLSVSQWEEVDQKLSSWGAYSSARFAVCVRGDTFLNLGLRKCAFSVSQLLLETGTSPSESPVLDPLNLNESGDDAMAMLVIGYTELGQRLRQLQIDLDDAASNVVLSDVQQDLDRRTVECRELLLSLASYNESWLRFLLARQVNIEADVRKKRFNELRGLVMIFSIRSTTNC
jgi:hypothetical protein